MSNSNIPPEQRKKSVRERLSEFITPQGLVGSVVFLVALAGVAWLVQAVFHHLSAGWGLPILALSSVLLLLGALLVFTTLIHLIDLSDPKSALGLPDGSVRALLALALLGLFAIMASSVLVNPPAHQLKGIPERLISALAQYNPNEPDIFWVPDRRTDSNQPLTFTAMINPTTHVDEFGKQMLTLVGTLMTAVISFYFGSAASSQTAQGESGAQPNPTGVSPTAATEQAAQLYTITGTRLANVTRIEAIPENGGSPVVADAKATNAEAKATLKLNKGKWTFHVHTASGAQAAVPVPIDVTEKPPAQGTEASPSAISPTTAKTATSQSYTITGTGLKSVTKVEALPPGGGASVQPASLQATDTEVKFDLSLPAVGSWRVQVTSGTAAPIPVPGTIEVTDA
jgi:hypothetical protein